MTTGENIREARKKAGLTQVQLAKKLGVPYQSIGQWETGKRNPKYETLERIASAIGIHVFDLVGIGEKFDTLVETTPFNLVVKFPSGEEVTLDDAPDDVKGILSFDVREVYHRLNDKHKEEFWGILRSGYQEIEANESQKRLKARLNAVFDRLSDEGKEKAVERIEELAEIPRYQRHSDNTQPTAQADFPTKE